MPESQYDAFISFGSSVDVDLAVTMQRLLARTGAPLYRRKSLNIFCDRPTLSAEPNLWHITTRALDTSTHFILLASPSTARSVLVEREAELWLSTHQSENFMIVQTDGIIAWDQDSNDFDWTQTTALPRVLANKFRTEPLIIDISRGQVDDFIYSEVKSAVLRLASILHRTPIGNLVDAEARRQRALRRLGIFIAALIPGAAGILSIRSFQDTLPEPLDPALILLAAIAPFIVAICLLAPQLASRTHQAEHLSWTSALEKYIAAIQQVDEKDRPHLDLSAPIVPAPIVSRLPITAGASALLVALSVAAYFVSQAPTLSAVAWPFYAYLCLAALGAISVTLGVFAQIQSRWARASIHYGLNALSKLDWATFSATPLLDLFQNIRKSLVENGNFEEDSRVGTELAGLRGGGRASHAVGDS